MNPKHKEAWALIINERLRQIVNDGYTSAHDDEHTEGQLALLAAAYALHSRSSRGKAMGVALRNIMDLLEVHSFPFKPADPIRDLTRAGALILAELERGLRAEGKP